MAHILVDRVKETTTTTGTGALSLGGAVTNFRDFDSVMANGDTTNYAIVHRTSAQWEVGRGTWNTGNTLTRNTVYAGTNGTSAVNLAAGTKDVFMTLNLAGAWPGISIDGASSIDFTGGAATLQQFGGRLILGSAQLAITEASDGSNPPIELTPGTLLAAPTAGQIELDATNFYATTDNDNRGYIPVEHFIRAASDQTLTSTTNEQGFFDSPANGTITLETGSYLFEWMGRLSSMSGTSGNARFDLLGNGSATLSAILWRFSGLDNSSTATITADLSVMLTGDTTGSSAVTAGTGTALRFHAHGSFAVTAAGTVRPSIALVTAAAAVVSAGSYYRVRRIGSTAVTSVGQWD